MTAALGLAARELGNVWPNPAVGCILVKAGRVIGRGWTQPGGRPHAEAEALRRAGEGARGAVAYITLEPCAHHGETPPCAHALAEAGIARAVIALQDPDPRVDGGGVRVLSDAGIDVATGVCAAEAEELNAGFIMRVTRGRPLVTLKCATTLDGRIATHGGMSRWITSEAARARAHNLRACHDAVMVGIGTALADDPELTCRLPGLEQRSPVRLVVDSRLRLALTSKLVQSADKVPTWVITLAGPDRERRRACVDCGLDVIGVDADRDGNLDLSAALQALGGRGLTRVLVEGGGRLAAGLLRAGVVDRLAWFRAPAVIGGDGVPVAAAFGIDELAQAPAFRRLSVAEIGDDLLETYAVAS
ncbi:MAG: bifunctional diaminohydroxyphosphoribosylaminopyrimidine deaminase/5-amino-6-(5-phosphoribosylamino)uracil reductase RibD [Kiloniellales bacterium]